MTDLAIAYGKSGRLPEAVALQEQTLAIKRRVLPPDHPFLKARGEGRPREERGEETPGRPRNGE